MTLGVLTCFLVQLDSFQMQRFPTRLLRQEDFAERLSKSMQFSDPVDQDPYGFYEKAEAHTGF